MAAGKLAVRLVNHLVDADPTFDFGAELERLILLAERLAFGPSTQALLDEAALRDIPSIRLNEQSLVQLGHGVHQKRIRATMTSLTGSLGVDIASDKKLTNKLLAATGVPVPRSEVVRDADGAVAAAKRIGYPVAMKPLDGNHGRGVMLNLADEDAVRAAYPASRGQSRTGAIVVETYLTGNDYRCLVIGGELRAVAQRVPAHVEGDGEHTLAELVEITNADPRRGIGHEKVLTRIKVDEEAIAYAREQGFELTDVPPRGERVYLKRTANMSTGGISIDRTEEAHPDNVELAELAARVVGLDIAGIDLICPDVGLPVRETGGGIVEVNAAPGLPDAHEPDRGRAAVRRQAGPRHALPAGGVVTDPDRGGHREQRQDDDRPDDHAHHEGDGPQGRPDLDRWHLRRRPDRPPRGRIGPEVRVDGAPEPDGRLRRLRGRPRRHPARGPRLPPQRRRRRAQRDRRPPRPRRHPLDPAARRGQAGRRRGRPARRGRGPQRRRPARRRHGAPLQRIGHLLQHRSRARATEVPGGARTAGGDARAGAQRRDDRPAPGAQVDVAGLDPPDPGHLRGSRADERPERAGRHRRLVGRRCPPPRHPPGPADVRDVATSWRRAG